MGIFRSGLVSGGGKLERDAEFVVALAGGDFGVGVGVDVGVDADGDGRFDAHFAGDVIDAGELGLALDVEGENTALERELDLGLGLADASEDAAFHIGASGEHAAEFAAAHEVKRRAEAREVPEHGEAGIGLHRVTKLHVEPGEAVGEAVVIIGHRGGAGDVSRGTVEAGDFGEIDGLAV